MDQMQQSIEALLILGNLTEMVDTRTNFKVTTQVRNLLD